jgi:polyhydroxybutyrate depolymerase
MRGMSAIAAALALAASGCGSSGSATTQTTTASAARPCAAGGRTPPASVPGAPLHTVLRVPPSARGHRAPLVLALHFASGTGEQMERVSRLTPQARRSGFVVAYPTASADDFWSIDNDLAALTRTIDAIERSACIDPARVYAVGISNGGFMSTVLACRMADRIAATVLFAPGVGGIGPCRPARAISVLEIHGTADPIVPYRGSAIPAFVAGWARRDGCAPRPRVRHTGATVTHMTWPGCRRGAQVQHLRLTGGRHIELLDELRAAGVDPAGTAWRFLSAHHLAD